MAYDLNMVYGIGTANVTIKGYGFTCSSGPAQGGEIIKPTGVAEEWYFAKGHGFQCNVQLPGTSGEVASFTTTGLVTVVNVPPPVYDKLSANFGNNTKDKYEFTLTTYQAIGGAGDLVPVVRMKFKLTGIDSKEANKVTGVLTDKGTIEHFNEQGVNVRTLNIDAQLQKVTT